MRTTLNLPEGLVEEARALLQFQSKTDTVIFALRELVRRKRIEDLKELMGSVDLRVDVAASRRRSEKPRIEYKKRVKSRGKRR